MGTTNKFSNFGFFAGSPRATHMVGAQGNIQDEDTNVVEFQIEESIDCDQNYSKKKLQFIDQDAFKEAVRVSSVNLKQDAERYVELKF